MIAAALSIPALGGLGFLWANLPWITSLGNGRWRLGPKSRFEKGRAVLLRRAEAILVHDDAGFHAVSSVCSHAQCTVKPRNARHVLACPCHGAEFAFDGTALRGPTEKPLPRFRVLEEDGELVLDTNRS